MAMTLRGRDRALGDISIRSGTSFSNTCAESESSMHLVKLHYAREEEQPATASATCYYALTMHAYVSATPTRLWRDRAI